MNSLGSSAFGQQDAASGPVVAGYFVDDDHSRIAVGVADVDQGVGDGLYQLALLILGERANMGTWIACVVGLGGALIILRPGIIEISLAALAAMVTAVCYSSANTCIKLLSRTESPVRITVMNNVLMLPLAFIPAVFVWITPSLGDVPWILALGLTNSLGGLFHARGVAAADARVVQPFTFLRLPWAVVVGYFLFAELPGIWTWIGASVIFGSSYYILYTEAGRRARRRG